MKIALISVAKDDPSGKGPIGFLPLFDGVIVEHQLLWAVQLGAERIIFLSPSMPGALLQYVDQLKDDGVAAEIVRSAADLMQYATATDEVIFIGDGILPRGEFLDILADNDRELIFVVDNAEQYSDFELIDLNHRWLGVATIQASRLAELADVPDDWDVGSALLRVAVQAGARRESITGTAIANGILAFLQNDDHIADFEQKRLRNPERVEGNFLSRFLFQPLQNRLIPKLWRMRSSAIYVKVACVGTGLFGVLAAWFGLTGTALILIFLTSVIQDLSQNLTAHRPVSKGRKWLASGALMLTTLGLVSIVKNESSLSLLWPNIVVLIIVMASLWLAKFRGKDGVLDLIKPDISLIILLLLCFHLLGLFSVGLNVMALFGMAFLIADQIIVSRAEEKRLVSAD
jgi:hypothetical protein